MESVRGGLVEWRRVLRLTARIVPFSLGSIGRHRSNLFPVSAIIIRLALAVLRQG